LHVLSMPPAFALSQDQTLRFIQAQPYQQAKTRRYDQTHAQQLKPSSIIINTAKPPPTQNHQMHRPRNTTPPSLPQQQRRPRFPPQIQ